MAQMLRSDAGFLASGAIGAALALALWFLLRRLWLRKGTDPYRSGVRPVALTLYAFLVLCGSVALAMFFVHSVLGLHISYWMIPVFGALGGLTGSIIRNRNQMALVSYDSVDCSLKLGFVGDMVLGLGGASATVFLLGSTLNFNVGESKTYPLMISISLISGVFGQLVIERAGRELQRDVDGLKKQTEKLSESGAAALVSASIVQYEQCDYDAAIIAAQKALEIEPKSIPAIAAKARALKKLNRTAEALDMIQARLNEPASSDTPTQRAALIYNVVCYRLLLGKIDTVDALRLLKEAFGTDPHLKKGACADGDLQSLRSNAEFQKLSGCTPPTPSAASSPLAETQVVPSEETSPKT